MSNVSSCPAFDSFVRILIFLDSTYFAPPFAHDPPTPAHLKFASPSYSDLSFGARTKIRAASVLEIQVSGN